MSDFVLRTPGPVGPPPERPVGPADVSDAPTCEHPRTDLRRQRCKNGVWVVRPQCVTCGHGLTFVKKDTVPGFEFLPLFDDVLRREWHDRVQKYWSDRRARTADAMVNHDAAWWAWYTAYLHSPQWRCIRDKVLARDAHLCQGCREWPATQVHHLTYERVGRELLIDLVSLCDVCHDVCHGRVAGPAETPDPPF